MTARHMLVANASFSAASGIAILVARNTLSPLFGLESSALLTVIGAGLVLYAGSLLVATPDRRTLLTAAVLDAGWVVGTALLLVMAWTALAPAARMLLIVGALIVEIFATVQFRLARTTLVSR